LASGVNHFRRREVPILPPVLAQSTTEIDVLEIHEEVLVKPSDPLEQIPSNE